MTVPMLPSTAIPRAKPNSENVSLIAAPEPAFSGSTELITMPAASVTMGAQPRFQTAKPTTRRARPEVRPIELTSATPVTETASPPAIRYPGRIRWATRGASMKPATEAATPGRVQRPVSNGDRPRTSCRY
jgi:hypothetical protein